MSRTRSILIIVTLGFLAILGIMYALNYASTGVLSVSTNNPDSVITAQIPGQKAIKLGQGTVSKRIKPGVYGITATYNDQATTAKVEVTKGEESTKTLTLVSTVKTITKGNYSGRSLIASGNTIYFLNTPFKILNTYTQGDTKAVPYLTNTYPVANVQWLSPTNGYYETVYGDINYFDGDNVVPVYTASSNNDQPATSVTSNSSGSLAYVLGSTVYVVAARTTTPRKLASLPSGDWGLSLADNGSILANDISQSVDSDKPKSHKRAVLINPTGSLTNLGTAFDYISEHASWSPDSQEFVYATDKGMFIYSIKTRQFDQLLSVRPTHAGTPTWISKTKFIYAQDTTLWLYSISTGTASKLAAIDGSLDPTQHLTLTNDSVYFGTDPASSGNGGGLYQFAKPSN